MRYFVNFGDEQVDVDVTPKAGGGYEVLVDGSPMDVDVADVDGHVLSIKLGDRVVDLAVEGTPPDMGIIASGHRFYARVESERFRATAALSGAGAGAGDKLVKSPMPGRVVSVRVEEGQSVERGQTIVVIEAMKMENELKAPADGVVQKVHVSAGQSVEGSAPLVELE